MRALMIIIALILPLTASAQFRVGVNMGYGSYAQKELTKFMIAVRNDLNVDAKLVESFPSYYNASINGYHIVGQLNWGVSITWGATGGRVSYKDFSGSIRRDMLVSYWSFGIPVGWTINPDDPWKLTLEATTYYNTTHARYSSELKVADQRNWDENDLFSLNFAVQPAIYVTREIGRFGFHLKGGYNITWLKGYLAEDGATDVFKYNNEKISADWNGYRVEAGVSIFLGRKDDATSEE
ncbi:MAG TPA: hypothetical protein VFE50_00160 [Cyclobacteriaceae bacterium]|nr:hypothetical protein [Cyclobacteriaceae bacterium]